MEDLLQHPAMEGAQCLLLEPGKPPRSFNGSGARRLNDTDLTADDIQRVLGLIVPADKQPALLNQPTVRCRVNIPSVGRYEVMISRTAEGTTLAFRPLPEPAASAAAIGTVGDAEPPPIFVNRSSAPVAQEGKTHTIAVPAGATVASNARTVSPAGLAVVPPGKAAAPEIEGFFAVQLAMKASDMHISADVVPMVRKDGEMVPMEGFRDALKAVDTERILAEMMPEKNRKEFERRHDTDFAYEFGSEARFRCNVFMDRKGWGGVFRVIPGKILTAEGLGLSKDILRLCFLSKGLVVVTGPTGSGKSTTLCAMVDYINRNRSDHIITIEDPIEFVHPNKQCLINQREVHTHTDSFKDALRAALREDPDILLVGEMRDLETISIAIETAETGHLVFGTLHTTTAPSTVDRIIDQFPTDRQSQVRVMLSESLKGVIAQTLCRKIGGGRVAALETLFCDHAIGNLIREGKTTQIPSAMQTGKAKGNLTMNEALFDLVRKKLVEPKEAYLKAVDKSGFESLLKRDNLDLSFIRNLGDSAAAVTPPAAPAAAAAR
jgi:twitching motility protein PilT